MPFTPFHFGPGLLLKGAMPQRFSFLAFSTTQVVIDLESWYHLTNGDANPHRILHTFVVGGAAGVLTGAGISLIATGVRRAIGQRASHLSIGERRPIFLAEAGLRGTVMGGLLGGLTHSLFDGLVHHDIQPLRPFALINPFEGLMSWTAVEMLCIAVGVLGSMLILARTHFWRASGPNDVFAAPIVDDSQRQS